MPVDHFEEKEFTGKLTGEVTRRIISLLKPYKWRVLGYLASIILVSVLDAYLTFLSKQLVDTGIIPGDRSIIIQILTQYGLMIIAQAAGIFGFIYLVGILGERIRFDLRQKLFNHLQMLSLSYYSQTPVGWIISRVTNDTERVAELMTWGFLDLTWGIVNIVTSLAFMFAINWRLALIVLVILPFLILAAVQFRKRILSQYREVRKINSKITASYNENITGVRVVKALGRETGKPQGIQRFDIRDVQSRFSRCLAERYVSAESFRSSRQQPLERSYGTPARKSISRASRSAGFRPLSRT